MKQKCVWKVSPKDRMCGYCVLRQGCKVRSTPRHGAEDACKKYVKFVWAVTGVNPLENTRKRMAVWGRNMIAYQLSLDGFVQEDIAKAVKKNRSTVTHSISSMQAALDSPNQYFNEVSCWNQFRRLVLSIKPKDNV